MPRFELMESHSLSGGISYGIVARDDVNGSLHWVCVPDVSANKEFVLQLIDRCNRGQLSASHLLDVVLDSLP